MYTFGTTTTRSIHRLTFGTVDTFQFHHMVLRKTLCKILIFWHFSWSTWEEEKIWVSWRCWQGHRHCSPLVSDLHTWHSYWPASRADTYFIWNPSLNINLILPFDPSLQSTSVFRPTFRVQRLSFAFFRDTKRSSEMKVSSSTCSQRNQCQRWKIWRMKIFSL